MNILKMPGAGKAYVTPAVADDHPDEVQKTPAAAAKSPKPAPTFTRREVINEATGRVRIIYSDRAPVERKRSDLACPHVINDRVEYKSMVTGEMITGRRQHREHLAEHDCEELGNEKITPTSPLEKAKADLKKTLPADIKEAIEQVKAGYQPDPEPEPSELTAIDVPDNVKTGDLIRGDV